MPGETEMKVIHGKVVFEVNANLSQRFTLAYFKLMPIDGHVGRTTPPPSGRGGNQTIRALSLKPLSKFMVNEGFLKIAVILK